MKTLHSFVLALTVFAVAAGCAKKEMIVADPSAGLGVEQAPPASPSPAPAATGVAAEPVIVADGAAGDMAPSGGDAVQASPLETVYFTFDSWILTAPAREALARNAEWLRKNPAVTVMLEGHTDERGSDAYNLALGEQRAKSALKYLSTLGIDAARMDVMSYGEEKPAVDGDDESAWGRNRRVEFIPRRN